jgi:hypothetical protein
MNLSYGHITKHSFRAYNTITKLHYITIFVYFISVSLQVTLAHPSPSSPNPHASLMTTLIPRSTAVMSFITHAIPVEAGAILASKYTASAFLYTTHLSVLKLEHISARLDFYSENLALQTKFSIERVRGLESS